MVAKPGIPPNRGPSTKYCIAFHVGPTLKQYNCTSHCVTQREWNKNSNFVSFTGRGPEAEILIMGSPV